MMTDQLIQPGDVWEINGSIFRVVGPDRHGEWPISGPGPCRALYYASTLVFQHNGKLIERRGAAPKGDDRV